MRQIEIPVHNSPIVTSRSLDPNHVTNAHITLKDQEKKTLLDTLKEILIRFDTNPKFYQKEDYKSLIKVLIQLSKIIDKNLYVLQEWSETPSDTQSPSEKLVVEALNEIKESIDFPVIDVQINGESVVSDKIARIEEEFATEQDILDLFASTTGIFNVSRFNQCYFGASEKKIGIFGNTYFGNAYFN